MALNFTATTHNVSCGHGTSINNLSQGTYAAWVKLNSTGTDKHAIQKSRDALGATKLLAINPSNFAYISVRRATTPLIVTASSLALTSGTWYFIVGTYNLAGTDSDQHIYVGSLSSIVAEPTYSAQIVGSGSAGDDSAVNLILGNNDTGAFNFDGHIAWVGIWNRPLTLGEIQAQQFHPHVTSGNAFFMHVGWNGTGTQGDWSGNANNGTVSNAAVSDHVPLGPLVLSAPRVPYVVAGGGPSASVSPSLSPSASVSPSTSVSPSASSSLSPSASVSPSASSSLSPSTSESPSASASVAPYNGTAWGEQNPNPEDEAVSWQTWHTAPATPVTVSGDTDWGKMQVDDGTPVLGPVVDTGDTALKTFTATTPEYGTNTGEVILLIRGSATSFAQHDVSPTWSVYIGPTKQSWRYVQVKAEYTEGLLADAVAYYRLDEYSDGSVDGSGRVRRVDSIGANHLLDNTRVISETGASDLAAKFVSASSQQLYCASSTALTMGSNTHFGICGWIKPHSAAFGVVLGRWPGAGNQEWAIEFSAQRALWFDITPDGNAANGSYAGSDSDQITLDTWNFFCAWYDGTNINIQTNNGTVHSAAFSTGAYVGTGLFYMGSLPTSAYFNGSLQKILISKRAWTADERTLLYNGGTPLDLVPRVATIELKPALTHQTMTGWVAHSQSSHLLVDDTLHSHINPNFATYGSVLLDDAVNNLGLNAIYIECNNRIENVNDPDGQYIAGSIGITTRNATSGINDDADTSSVATWIAANPTNAAVPGFGFGGMDDIIDRIVNPFRALVAANGETPYVYVRYFHGPESGFIPFDTAAEFGEFALAIYHHVNVKYGWYFDAFSVVNEPDGHGINGTQLGNATAAAISALEGAGYTAKFILPETTALDISSIYPDIETTLGTSEVSAHVSHLSYHRYTGGNASLPVTRAYAQARGIGTAQLEWIGATYAELHLDLKQADNDLWSQYVLAYETSDSGAQYYTISGTAVTMGSRTKLLRQYFKYVRRGAVRIEATSNSSLLDAVAFINTNGKYVVVVKATGASGTFTVGPLPSGTYGIKYTTATNYDINLADQTGTSVSASIPAAGALTIYGK